MTIDELIATSTAGFNTAFGFSIPNAIAFMKTWLTYIIGAGLGLLQALMPFIVGLVVLGAVVYFLYRAFKFFRH